MSRNSENPLILLVILCSTKIPNRIKINPMIMRNETDNFRSRMSLYSADLRPKTSRYWMLFYSYVDWRKGIGNVLSTGEYLEDKDILVIFSICFLLFLLFCLYKALL